MRYLKKIQYNSPVILSYTIISFIVLIIGTITSGASNHLLFSAYRSSLTNIFFYFRLFGHIFGHINFQHFFNNFLIILLVGPMLEEKYGSKNITIMILFTALFTGIIHVIFFKTALLGASGICFMFILLSSFVNIEKEKIPFTFILVIFIFLGKEIIDATVKNNNISQTSHIIGGICGSIFGFIYNKITITFIGKKETVLKKGDEKND